MPNNCDDDDDDDNVASLALRMTGGALEPPVVDEVDADEDEVE